MFSTPIKGALHKLNFKRHQNMQAGAKILKSKRSKTMSFIYKNTIELGSPKLH